MPAKQAHADSGTATANRPRVCGKPRATPMLGKAMAKIPLHPRNPDRTCWGCERYCAADQLGCGNGTIRTPHPAELFGDDWLEWIGEVEVAAPPRAAGS